MGMSKDYLENLWALIVGSFYEWREGETGLVGGLGFGRGPPFENLLNKAFMNANSTTLSPQGG